MFGSRSNKAARRVRGRFAPEQDVDSRRLTAAGAVRRTLSAGYWGGAVVGEVRRTLSAGYWEEGAAGYFGGARFPKTNNRRGITLIELLVVISILTLVAVITIPRMRPMMENRQVRESARALNVFLSQARIRATETGRPCGVLFERANDRAQPNACTVMRQVEIPPPYAGDTITAVVRVRRFPASGPTSVPLKMRVRDGDFSPGLIRRGDRVQLNHQGPVYTIVDDLSDNTPADQASYPAGTADPGADVPVDSGTGPFRGFLDFTAGTTSTDSLGNVWVTDHWLSLLPEAGVATVPWVNSWSQRPPMPFTIFRQPTFDPGAGLSGAFASIAPSLQLPRGAVVDLGFSGLDAAGIQFAPVSAADPSPVIVMFSPSGALDRVYSRGIIPEGQARVTAPVFLLVGRWERVIQPLPDDGLNNWQDLTNFWLAISPQTGLITVAPPASVDLSVPPPKQVNASRRLVREAQISQGGR